MGLGLFSPHALLLLWYVQGEAHAGIVRKRCEQRSEAGVMCPATVKSAEVSEFPNKQAASCFYPKARSR